MANLPRLAIGSVQPATDTTAATWALLEVLTRHGVRLQCFQAQACFCPRDGATAITGVPARHLDSWLMSRSLCQQVFERGCGDCELAIVEGSFLDSPAVPSHLTTLCDWLALPGVAVIDARTLDSAGPALPERPAAVQGVLLDYVRDAAHYERLRALLAHAWNVPAFGWLPPLAPLREQIARIDCGDQPSAALCTSLGDALQASLREEPLLRLARSQPWSAPPRSPAASSEMPVHAAAPSRPFQVAIAYDEAFHGYFPDTLDLLEQRGASIVDFSPLHDEQLPPHTDVVYVGCGHPERFARQLAENDCLILSLKSHVSCGRRVYAECGGLAYLCQHLELADGERWPMAGVLPATAHLDPTASSPAPAEFELTGDTWLAAAGQAVRGYLNPRWSITAAPQLIGLGTAGHEHDIVSCHHCVGSRVYVHLAAHDALLASFAAHSPQAVPHPHPA